MVNPKVVEEKKSIEGFMMQMSGSPTSIWFRKGYSDGVRGETDNDKQNICTKTNCHPE